MGAKAKNVSIADLGRDGFEIVLALNGLLDGFGLLERVKFDALKVLYNGDR